MKATSTRTSTVSKDVASNRETSTNDASSTLHLPSGYTPYGEQICMGSMGEAHYPIYYGGRMMAGRIMCCRNKTSLLLERRHLESFHGNIAVSTPATHMKRSNVK